VETQVATGKITVMRVCYCRDQRGRKAIQIRPEDSLFEGGEMHLKVETTGVSLR